MADETRSRSPVRSVPDHVELTNDSPKDHMSTVAALINQEQQESRQSSTSSQGKPHRKVRRKASKAVHADEGSSPDSPPLRQSERLSNAGIDDENLISVPPPPDLDNVIELSDSDDMRITDIRPKGPPKTQPIFHKFLDLPPEIRNRVYSFLLTTPGIPIEFPRLTGPEGRRREVAWTKCKTPQSRRVHKSIFLEILSTSKQIQFEALPLIYGCNTFKYRCGIYSHFEGRSRPRTPTAVTLPTRHLSLLKHIKIAVILDRSWGRVPEEGSINWWKAAGLIEQFGAEGLDLETFEMTLYAFFPITLHPTRTTELHDALRKIRASRSFRIHVLPEARLSPEMKASLEEGARAGGAGRVEVTGKVDFGVERGDR